MLHRPTWTERILAASTYATLGWVGVAILIVQVLCKKSPTLFVMYHVMQSIFMFFAYFVLCQFLGLLKVLIAAIPLLNSIPVLLNSPLPLLGGFSFVQALTSTVLLYLVLTSLAGRYSYLPWVSDIIKYWVKR